MSFRFLLILFLFSAFIGISACTYNKEDELYVQSNVQTCDTTSVTFNNQVKSILKAHCDKCHAGAATGGVGIKIETYDEVKSFSENRLLLESIIRDANPMPKNDSRLSSCKINQIRAWINQGLKE